MKIKNKIVSMLITSFITTVIFGIKTFAVTGVITEITVNVRQKPSTDSKRIMYVTQDEKVEVLEKDGEWYKIESKGKTGYVFEKYVDVDESELSDKSEEENKDDSENEETSTNEEVLNETSSNEKNENTSTNNKINPDSKLYLESETEVKIIPNISSSNVSKTNEKIEIQLFEQLGNWAYVLANGKNGWVRIDKIIEEKKQSDSNENDNKSEEESTKEDESSNNDSSKEENKKAYIKYNTVNLRKKASATSTILAKLKINDEVTILEKTNSVWTKVEIDGKTGYVSNDLLATEKQNVEDKKDETTTSRSGETTSRESDDEEEQVEEKEKEKSSTEEKNSSNTSITGTSVVEYAKKFLGYKYVYGGTSPEKGFDCSGFTSYVYKNFGYNLSRSSSAQANNGTKVEKSDIKPGDILIFKNQALTKIGHVGIYIGDNKMIHASEPGVGVTITDLDARGYNYNKRYVTARRIIK